MVAVAYGKGVVLCQPYEKLNGFFFAQFIQQCFNITFGKAGPKAQRKRIFVMDNDPSQMSKKAMEALNDIEAELHRLPSRSQHLNPPEHIFHLVKMNLEKEALEQKITNESFEQFRERVFNSFQLIDTEVIDKTIESLPRRIHKIIALSGVIVKKSSPKNLSADCRPSVGRLLHHVNCSCLPQFSFFLNLSVN